MVVMGLFDKLLDSAKKIADTVETVQSALETSASGKPSEQPRNENVSVQPQSDVYDDIPAEENQYNSGLPYDAYFEKIYREEFPDYKITKEAGTYTRPSCILTFVKGGKKALVVELLSDRSEVKKLRTICRNSGIPYLRFYYDHHGWWNLKSYVIERTRQELGE